MKSRVPWPHAVFLVVGTLIGVIFGDRAFPQIEAMFGDPATDIFFGFVGAFFAGIAYEMVAMFLRPH